MPLSNKRYDWIDIARGIGIILVVFGHCAGGIYPTLIAMLDIFSLPLFFIIAGYLFKPQKNLILSLYTKAIRFLLPFISIFLLIVTISLFLNLFTIEYTIKHLKKMVWGGIYWWHCFRGYFTPMWFLACMFMTQIIYNFFHKYFSQFTINIISLLMLIGAYLYQIYLFNVWIPWFANIVLMALPLYNIGYIIRTKDIHFSPKLVYVIAISYFLSIFWFPLNHNRFIQNYYGIPVITFIGGIFGSLLVMDIAKRIERRKSKFKEIFKSLGKSSLIILGFHISILYICSNLNLFRINSYYLRSIFFTIFTISISHLLYLIFNKYRITQILFLGNYQELNKIVKKLMTFVIHKKQ